MELTPDESHKERKISAATLGIAGIFAHRIASYNWVMVNSRKHLIFVERTHGIVANGPVLEFDHHGAVKTHMMPFMPYELKNPSIVFVRENEENGKVYLISSEASTHVVMYDTFRNEFKFFRGFRGLPRRYGSQTCVKFDD